MPLKLGVVSAVLFSLCSFSATAGVIQVTSLTSNDYFDWGQIQNNPSVPSPQSITSSLLGRTGSISDTAGFTGETENSDWVGNFTKGDKVLYDGDPNMAFNSGNSVEVDFNTPIAGLLTQIQPGVYGLFSASLEVFDGATSLGVFSVNGDSEDFEDGSAPFIGALSDSNDITRAIFTLTSNTGFGFGINRLFTADALTTAVPEPFTLSLFGAGLVGALAVRRRKKKPA